MTYPKFLAYSIVLEFAQILMLLTSSEIRSFFLVFSGILGGAIFVKDLEALCTALGRNINDGLVGGVRVLCPPAKWAFAGIQHAYGAWRI